MGSKKKYRNQEKKLQEQVTVDKKPTQKKQSHQPGNTISWSNSVIVFVVLIALAFLLYGNSLGHDYVLDDQMVITKNAYVQEGRKGLPDIFSYDSFMGYFQNEDNLYLLPGGRYRPLSLATFAMETEWFGIGKPAISHGINIFLYGFTAFLLFIVLTKMLPLAAEKTWLTGIPFLAAVIWLMHPLHTEVVANIKGRDEILSLLFSLGSLWASLLYIDRNKKRWLALALLFLFFGMLAKENALTFIAVIPLSCYFFRQVSFQQLVRFTGLLLIPVLLFIIIRYRALGFFFDHGHPVNDIMNDPFIGLSSTERYATVFYTLGWYIKLLFLPYPLTHDYYPYQVPVVDWSDIIALLSLLFYVATGLLALWQLKKKTISSYAILFFVITLSMASNLFFTVGTFMNERFLYMPSVAFALWISWLLVSYLPKKINNAGAKWAGVSLLAITAIFFAWKTMARVPDWKNAETLNVAAMKVSPNSARANCFYAVHLYEDRYLKEKDTAIKNKLVDSMLYYINRSLNILPSYGSALQMKSGIVAARYQRDGNIDSLYRDFESITKGIPANKENRDFLLKYLQYLRGRYPEKTVAFCYKMGYEFYFKKQKDYPMAVSILEEARMNIPTDRNILNALAEVYTASGEKQKASAIQVQLQSGMQ